MNPVQKNISLKAINTFGIDAKAAAYTTFRSAEELVQILKNPETGNIPRMILGGGSNILFLDHFPGIILQNKIDYIQDLPAGTSGKKRVQAGSGTEWNALVNYCVDHQLGGIENMALIPGTCGAAPIQNIGAYGIELKDVFISLEALNLDTFETEIFSREACQFSYRNSYFKQAGKGKYCILSITLELSTENHILHTRYGAIQSELNARGIHNPGIQDIRDIVVSIRQSKLPDPKRTGNAGSFFKNPEITEAEYLKLAELFPDLVSFETTPGFRKLAAGWLIEQAGWKGFRDGDAGVHPLQALVLVNYGNAQGKDIQSLSEKIQKSVQDKFGVWLEAEVNMI